MAISSSPLNPATATTCGRLRRSRFWTIAQTSAGSTTRAVSLVRAAMANDSAAPVAAEMLLRGEAARTNASSSQGVTRLSRNVQRLYISSSGQSPNTSTAPAAPHRLNCRRRASANRSMLLASLASSMHSLPNPMAESYRLKPLVSIDHNEIWIQPAGAWS
jgi:hypothetical protein